MFGKQRIAWVGSILEPNIRTDAHLFHETLPELNSICDLEIFTWERPLPKIAEHKIFHILSLAEQATKNPYSTIIYNLTNTLESYLFYRSLTNIPGIVILHDGSLLDCLIASLRYSSDKTSINDFFKIHYPNSTVDIGQEHILDRSIFVYNLFYPFTSKLNELATSLIFLDSRVCNFFLANSNDNSLEKLKLSDYPIGPKINLNKGIDIGIESRGLLILPSPLSKISEEILAIIGLDYKKCDYPCYFSLTINKSSSLELTKLENLSDLSSISFLILSHLEDFQGIPPIIRNIDIRNTKLFLPRPLKSTFGERNNVSYHDRGFTLNQILTNLNSNYNINNKCLEPDSISKFYLRQSTSFLSIIEDKLNELKIGVGARGHNTALPSSLDQIDINFDSTNEIELSRRLNLEINELFFIN